MASKKTCFKCRLPKPLTDFYRHAAMADGHLNKCKECTKKDATKHRRTHASVQAYERQRSKLPHRRALMDRITKQYRAEHRERYAANIVVNNAIRDGKLTPLPCWVCDSPKTVGHHPDYDAPLAVIWLCSAHHKQLHAEAACRPILIT